MHREHSAKKQAWSLKCMRELFGCKVGGANGCEGDCCVNLWGKCCDVTKNVYIWENFFTLP